MIINRDTNPERSLYYVGSVVLRELKESSNKELDFLQLYKSLKENIDISMNLFTLSLDWLYLNGIIEMKEGNIVQCS